MFFLWFLVPIFFMVVALWNWEQYTKSTEPIESILETPDYKKIAGLERELGLISAFTDEEFDREIDKAAPVAPDPLVEFMTDTYAQAMKYVILPSRSGYYTNTDPHQSILTEMFKE